MENTKPWYASTGVWGGIVAGAAGIAALFGLTVEDADVQAIAQGMAAAGGAIGGLMAAIGRIRAKSRIGAK